MEEEKRLFAIAEFECPQFASPEQHEICLEITSNLFGIVVNYCPTVAQPPIAPPKKSIILNLSFPEYPVKTHQVKDGVSIVGTSS
jgi:hypothetical protein